MASFDFSNWSKYRSVYLVIILVVVIAILLIRRQQKVEEKGQGQLGPDGEPRVEQDGNGESHYYARGSPKDSTSELLDRIEWASYLEKRTCFPIKALLMSLIIVGLIIVLVLRKLPHPTKVLILLVTVFIPIYAVHQLKYTHSDIYNDFYIKNNVDLLRAQLGLQRGSVRHPRCDPPARAQVMNPK